MARWHCRNAPQCSGLRPSPSRSSPSSRSPARRARRDRHYQENFADDDEVLANDRWTNTATVSGNDFVICSGGVDGTDCAGHPKIDHDETDGLPDLDGASADQEAQGPNLDKKVAVSGTDCDAATYSDASQHYAPGDRVCWKVRMEFPGGTPTGNVTLTDFLPLGHTYEAASFHVTGANTVPIDSFDDAQAGLLIWRLGTSGVAGQNDVFEGVLSTIVNQQVSPAFPGQLTQNLLKASTTNTPETSYPLRDDAGVIIDAPVVTLDKSVFQVNGGAPVGSPPRALPGQVVRYRVRLGNTGASTAEDVEVWDDLPTGIACGDVTNAGSGSCAAGRMTWTVASLAASATTDLEYRVTGRVVASDGRVVPGQAVRVKPPGRAALALQTDALGRFAFVTRPPSSATRIRAEALGCEARATIAAKAAPSCRTISVTPARVTARKTTRVRIRLTANGHRLGFAAVRLHGAGIDARARTNASGLATVRVKATRAGILAVDAKRVARCVRQVGVVAAGTAPQFTG